MKKVLSVAAVALALSATTAQANEGMYLGANYQFNKITTSELNEVFKNDTKTLNLVAGYDFNEFFAVEGNFGLGMGSNSESFDTGAFVVDREHNVQARLQGKTSNKQGLSYGIYAVGKLPVHDMFGLYAKVGFASMSYESSIEAKETIENKNLGKATEKTNIGGLSYAIGAEFNVMPELAITAEYTGLGDSKEYGFKPFGDKKMKFQASAFNIGMKYKF